MAPWVTLPDARAWWGDAPADDAVLTHLLALAQDVCTANLPAADLEPMPAPIPDRWQHAVVLAAQDSWQASTRDGDVIGFGDYAVRVRMLSADVLGLLRPYRGPVLG